MAARKSKEHVLPEWLLKAWGRDVHAIVAGEDRGSYTVKVLVCEKCNNWMNVAFENAVRDLINELRTGLRSSVSPDDQRRLAGWFTKTILMLNLWREFDIDQYLRPDDYRNFRTTEQFPSGTRIWLGSIEDTDPVLAAAVVQAVPTLRENASAPQSRIFPRGSSLYTFSIDHLVVLWIRDNRPDEATLPESDPRRLIRHCARRGLLIPIWPPTPGPTSWPPRVPFDVTTYERWRRLFAWR